MRTLFQANIILFLAVFVAFSDIAIKAAVAKSYIRAACYGIVALFALIALLLALVV